MVADAIDGVVVDGRHNWQPTSVATLVADCCCCCSPAPALVMRHREFYRTPVIVKERNIIIILHIYGIEHR